jgi:hypothetical protein
MWEEGRGWKLGCKGFKPEVYLFELQNIFWFCFSFFSYHSSSLVLKGFELLTLGLECGGKADKQIMRSQCDNHVLYQWQETLGEPAKAP